MRIPCVAEQKRQQRDDLGLIGISMFISDSMTAIYVITYSTGSCTSLSRGNRGYDHQYEDRNNRIAGLKNEKTFSRLT